MRYLILLLYAINASSVISQDAEFVSLKKFTQVQGLSAYYITKIIQDSKGFFWIGTQDGLNKFDGLHFSIIDKKAKGINGSYIADLFEDKKRNAVWIATTFGDVCAIDITTNTIVKRIEKDNKGNSINQLWIRSVNVTGDILWFGTTKGLFAYNLTTERFLDLDATTGYNFSRLNVAKLFVTANGQMLACCDDMGIAVIDSKACTLKKIIYQGSLNTFHTNTKLRFWDVAEDKQGKVYIASSYGLKVFETATGSVERLSIERFKPYEKEEIFACAADSEENIWIATTEKLFKISTGKTTNIIGSEPDSDIWFSSIYQVYCFRNKSCLLGTQEGLGFFSLENSPFTTFFRSKNSDERLKHLYAIRPVNDSILLCGDETGIYTVNKHSGEIKKNDNTGSNYQISLLYKKQLLVSNEKGLSLIKNGKTIKAEKMYPCLKPVGKDRFSSILDFNDSLMFFGSIMQKGLYTWNKKNQTLKIYHKDSFPNNIPGLSVVNWLHKTTDGKLLILSQNSVFTYDIIKRTSTEHFLKDPDTNDTLTIPFDVCENGKNFWFGCYGKGIVQTDKSFAVKKVINEKDGLPSNAVYKVFLYRDSLLIATTNNGLSVINTRSGLIKNYYQVDGLHSNSFEQLCGITDGNLIYAGGINGLTAINPAKFSINKNPPAVYFTNIQIRKNKNKVEDTINTELKKYAIKNDWVQANVSFTGINYSNPERVTYQYRIKENDTAWINNGTQNFVSLIGLRPGTYTLEVKAANEDGYWSKPKTLTLLFEPKWYQTWWFYALIAIAVLGILYAFYRYRIYQLKMQQEKEHALRTEIAGDLHDDIGGTLNSVKIFTHLAETATEKQKYFTEIKHSVKQATEGLRDLIWVLDDKDDSVEELVERLKQFAQPVADASGISLKFFTDGMAMITLDKKEKRNLLLVIKEAINNCFKYAGCTLIEVTFSKENGQKKIIIKDNGAGFSHNAIKPGNGLKNMQTRAKQIRYEIKLDSALNQGTVITLWSKA